MDYKSFFNENKYVVIKNIVSTELCNFLSIETKLLENSMYHYSNTIPDDFPFGDIQCKNSFSYYSPNFAEAMLIYLQPVIENIIGIQLIPSCSYARVYYNGCDLKKHIDKNAREYTATLCINIDNKNWDFHIENSVNNDNIISLDVGDLVFFKGNELYHWRNIYEGTQQIQIFLHYIDRNGEHTNYKFDTRKMLGIAKFVNTIK